MADITKIQLPSGDVYNIKDENTSISATYETAGTYPKRVVLTVGSLTDADSTEY